MTMRMVLWSMAAGASMMWGWARHIEHDKARRWAEAEGKLRAIHEAVVQAQNHRETL